MGNIKKIGIDCRMIKESGIGRYVENLIKNLTDLDLVNTYYLFALKKTDLEFKLPPNFKVVEAPIHWHSFSEQVFLLKLINSYGLDLYHSPHPNMPYFYKKKFIITIHDLTMLKQRTGKASTYIYPLYFLKWLVFKILIKSALKRAIKIITVSNFVKDQIVSEFKIPADKVEVIYNGISQSLRRIEDKDLITELRLKQKLFKPFLFYVGNAYPHKNLERLIIAFELLNKNSELQLFLGGKEDYFYKRLKDSFGNLPNIIFGGHLTDEEISILYSSCEAFVYPSISEGFGLQIAEALNVGCKVICSDNSSFPEIASKFAFYFNPYNIEDMQKVISNSIKLPNKNNKEELKKHLSKFEWKNSAQHHYELYKKN